MFQLLKNLFKGNNQTQTKHEPIIFEDTNQILTMDDLFWVTTDTATLAIFDTQVLMHRLEDDIDWFLEAPYHQLQEVASGDCALISLGANGAYKIRATLHELSEEEKRFSKGFVTVGVKIVSDQCFIGNAESLPGDNYSPTPQTLDITAGGFLTIEPGLYNVHVYPLAIPISLETPNLPDIVLVFKPRTDVFQAPQQEPSLAMVL